MARQNCSVGNDLLRCFFAWRQPLTASHAGLIIIAVTVTLASPALNTGSATDVVPRRCMDENTRMTVFFSTTALQ
jgi:hypothetical protein